MKNYNESIETLTEIRSMMERSTRFISLNGFSGVFAGIFALIGAAAACEYLQTKVLIPNFTASEDGSSRSFYLFFFTDAILVLVTSVSVAVYLTVRKSKKKGLKVWDNSAKRVIFNMLLPLSAGGLFCLLLVYHGYVGLVAPSTLIFYGLALLNTSKYTYEDIRYLGIIEVLIGLLATIWIGYGLLFWALGFGVMHVIYGIIMYFKYER